MGWELELLNGIQTLRTPLGDILMPLITLFGEGGIFWILLTLALLAFPKTRRCGGIAALGLILEFLSCNLILKPLAARVRPCDVNTAVRLLVERPTDFSFPSGHTGASFAVAASYLLGGSRRLGYPALVLAALIAFSRMYLYVHYPTDVLAGLVLGVASAFLARFAAEKLEAWRRSRRASGPKSGDPA